MLMGILGSRETKLKAKIHTPEPGCYWREGSESFQHIFLSSIFIAYPFTILLMGSEKELTKMEEESIISCANTTLYKWRIQQVQRSPVISPYHTADPEPGPKQAAKTISQYIWKLNEKLSLPVVPSDVCFFFCFFACGGIPYQLNYIVEFVLFMSLSLS